MPEINFGINNYLLCWEKAIHVIHMLDYLAHLPNANVSNIIRFVEEASKWFVREERVARTSGFAILASALMCLDGRQIEGSRGLFCNK